MNHKEIYFKLIIWYVRFYRLLKEIMRWVCLFIFEKKLNIH